MVLPKIESAMRAWVLLVSSLVLMANGPVALRSGAAVDLAGVPFAVQSAEASRGVEYDHNNVLRFKVVPGAVWQGDRRAGKANERAEISSKLRGYFGETMSAKFSIRLGNNPGLRKGRDWMVLAQIHGPNRNTLPEGRSFASPVFALELRGDELVFIARGGSEVDGETGQRIVGSIPARFGSWQSFSVIAELRDDGRLGIATDEGTFFTNGPVGYDAGDAMHYWKFGIYRSPGIKVTQSMDFYLHCLGVSGPCEGAAQ